MCYEYLKQKHLWCKKWCGQKKMATKMTDIRMWPRFVSQCIMGCTKASLKLQLFLTQLRFMN